MSHTPQQPADGWQPPQQQPPVYRPNEQPPHEDAPWSPESQRMAQSGRQGPVEEDGTVKYVGGPGQPSPQQFGPPPGVPVSPFDAPQPQAFQNMPPQQPYQSMPPQQPFQASPPPPSISDPFGPAGGMPVSGMPVSGMPPVSSIPASGMPVSGMPVSAPMGPGGQPPFGGGQFGPQGGQLVPISGGGAQPWGAPDTIQRKGKKKGGKGTMWLIVAGIVVIALALGVGGFILFNPFEDNGDDTATIESNQATESQAAESSEAAESSAAESSAPAEPEPETPAVQTVVANEASGLSILAAEGSTEAANPPGGFTGATGLLLAGTGPTVFFGALDPATIGAGADVPIADLSGNLQNLAATWAGGAAEGAQATQYRVDARSAYFNTFTVGDLTVMTAVIENGDGYVGFVGSATADQVEALEAARGSISFGA
ncbi:hypothetical protein [Glycomyces algeriensis]|uniref:Uncharacterized protein n=1 Tax=Glycomyces algeriensis TaxID=256037 RepID=A0A9W6LJN4_9ACTN|nr:hypothetical protein [Glycomyces algeriensis]MDA1366489.1 hypothetical protein [Glycomyces algeriensis]MDR7352147.1 hypothetical protein [Glycomyces algeriensis]GLI44881.1 hypothetical protein GALLR39Z86_47310 [Glycomyces algeriensis]